MPAIGRKAFDPASLFASLRSPPKRVGYREGDVVLTQGDTAEDLFYIEQGAVKETYTSKEGKERIIAIIKPREFFGTECITAASKLRTTSIAIMDCVVLRIEKEPMIEALFSDSRIAEMFIDFLVEQRQHYEEMLVDHLVYTSEERLARTLLRLSRLGLGNETSDQVLLPKISQETLAEIVGTTRSRINVFISKLRHQNLLEFDGRIRLFHKRLQQRLQDQDALDDLAAPSRQYRPRVVLVDDHPAVLSALSRFMESDCEVVASVDNGQQAVESVDRLKPEVMVVDLIMPEMNGLEVCRRVKEMAPETDVIIVTAFDDGHVEKVALQAGASAFVAKHAASGALMSTIQRLVQKKQSGLRSSGARY